MDKSKLIKKLSDTTGITLGEAEDALDKSQWNILDAMIILEDSGRIPKPSLSIFYSNGYKNYSNECDDKYSDESASNEENNNSNSNGSNKFFEKVCKIVDVGNNIFFQVRQDGKVIFDIPITVLVLLFMFLFWVIVPLIILGLFFDMDFYVSSNKTDTFKVNKIIRKIKLKVMDIKKEFKKEGDDD